MKLRNLIFSLFLAIGAIAFTACTGDDGDAGPAGPAGPAGEQGPPGEPAEGADVDSREFFYPFLATWGAGADGGAACNDAIISGEGIFPGPASLTPLTMAEAALPQNLAVGVACAANFVESNHDPDGMGPLEDVLTDDIDGLVLVKSARGAEPAETVDNIPDTLDPQTRTVTTKSFVGGGIYAELDDTGASGESFYRGRLHNTCGVGTAPPNLAGEWRGVHIVATTHQRTGTVATGFMDVEASEVEVDTRKLCVVLDSTPGVAKCYIRTVTTSPDDGDITDDNADRDVKVEEVVGLYAPDGTVHPVAPMATMGTVPGTDSVDVTILGTADDLAAAKICNLFPAE